MGKSDVVHVKDTVAYDRAALDEQLSDVGRYLTELSYIDQTLSYLDDRDDPRAYATEPLVAPYEQYDVQVGETFPLTRTIRVLDPRFDPDFEIGEDDRPTGDMYEQVMHDIAGIKVWAATWGQDNLASLTETISEIAHSVPEIYEDSIIAPLKTTHTILQEGVSSDFGHLRHSVDDWRGEAAENFATNFHHPFGDMRASQEHLVEALVGGAVTARAIDQSAQHSLMNAVHYVRLMLREQLQQRQQQGNAAQPEHEPGPLGSATTIAILAGGSSVMSAAAGSKLWAIGMEFLSAGLNIAATGVPTQATTEFKLEGQTAEQLIDTLAMAIRDIKTNMATQYDVLKDALDVEVLPKGADVTQRPGWRRRPALPSPPPHRRGRRR